MRFYRIEVLCLALALLAALNTGCSSGPRPVAWNLSIEKKTVASIDVDIIGIQAGDEANWRGIRPDDYWNSGSSVRASAAGQMKSFNFQDSPHWSLAEDDPIWNTWLKTYQATELVIMARLPGLDFDNGPNDRRRYFVRLGKDAWKSKDKTLTFELNDSFITPLTPLVPPK